MSLWSALVVSVRAHRSGGGRSTARRPTRITSRCDTWSTTGPRSTGLVPKPSHGAPAAYAAACLTARIGRKLSVNFLVSRQGTVLRLSWSTVRFQVNA
jgi:hypothetical protein